MLDRLEKEIEMVDRHLEVLEAVMDDGPIGIVNLSERTDLPRHKIRYSLRVLEENGLIEPTNSGARTTDETEEFVSEMEDDVSELVDVLRNLKFDDD